MILLIISFVICKLLLFGLPAAANLGRFGRGILREAFIALNLLIGYHFLPQSQAKKEFVQWGIAFELLFIAFVTTYAILPKPPTLLMQLQVMFRELLLSPLYFFGYYMVRVKHNAWVDKRS